MANTADERQKQLRIAEIRRQIAAGTYESSDKLDAAMEGFLDDFGDGALRPGEDRPRPHPK